LTAHTKGRVVLQAVDEDIGPVISDAFCEDDDADAMCLARAAIVCNEIFSETDTSNGTFPQNCQRESIPQTLLVLVDMILEGSNPICHPPE